MYAKQRLLLTADESKLVPEGHPDGATLYCSPGDEIPDSAAERFGLVDGELPAGGSKEGPARPNKEKPPAEDKDKQPGEDKGAGSGTKGAGATEPPVADDLSQVKFIGEKSAAALVAVGITTFAQVAAIDPASPPAAEGMGARTNWAGIVASAKELVAKAAPSATAAETDQGAGAASGDGGAGAGDTDQVGA